MDSAADLVDRLERRLMSLGVYVERHAVEDTNEGETLHVEYETAAGGLPPGEVGTVCTELLDAHEAGWTPQDCHFWAFETGGAGQFLGDWRVSAGWVQALDRGDISETDFSTLVLSTRRRPDDDTTASPEPDP